MFKRLFPRNQPKGLVLPEYKNLSNHDGQIRTLPLYEKYYVSLLQRDGETAVPVVKIGDSVNAGDVVARPTSNLALHRHAPTSGEVTAIVKIRESHPSGMIVDALEITADGADTSGQQFPPIPHFYTQDKAELLTRIFRAGIAGMGGAGFPTEKKIHLEKPVDTLIINGAECEPYITCDDLLMRHHAEEILTGALIFAYILSAKRILVGIEDNKPQAISQMQTAAKRLNDNPLFAKTQPNIDIHAVPTQYPMGSRHQIAHFLMGKKTNIRQRSYQSGFVCHNVATVKAGYDAVVNGKPLTERLVTFSGDAVQRPAVYLSKVGSDLADVAASVGINPHCQSVIFGGTMMGFAAVFPNDKPIVVKRETTSILAFSQPVSSAQSKEQNCIRCGHCADVCPMDLLPQQLQFYGRSGEHSQAENNRLFDCIECGLCTYVCPSDIPLVQIFQHSKGEILAERKKKQDSEHTRIRFETRNARLAAEKAEKAQKAAERRAKLAANTQKTAATAASASRTKNNQSADLIAAALARAQEKKAHREPSNPPAANSAANSTPNTADNTKAQDLIAAALARTQAKKAQQKIPPKQPANKPTEEN